jgi:hypothetical protein
MFFIEFNLRQSLSRSLANIVVLNVWNELSSCCNYP